MEDSVCDEYFNNSLKEIERRRADSVHGTSFFSRMFDFSGEQRADMDLDYSNAYSFVTDKIDSLTAQELKLEGEFEKELKNKSKDTIEISLTSKYLCFKNDKGRFTGEN